MEAKTGSKLMRWLQSYFILVMIAVVALETGIAGLAGLRARRQDSAQSASQSNGPCDPPRLALGTKQYTIKTIKSQLGGSFEVPGDQPDTAFWLEGTTNNQIYGLRPKAG